MNLVPGAGSSAGLGLSEGFLLLLVPLGKLRHKAAPGLLAPLPALCGELKPSARGRAPGEQGCSGC